MLGGAGSHRRVNGIKSESYSGDINRLSYSHLASLKLKNAKIKGIFLEIVSHICENVLVTKFPHLTLRH